MRIEASEEIVEDVQRLDALQSCRVPFFTFEERSEQLQECERITASVADKILTLLLLQIKK